MDHHRTIDHHVSGIGELSLTELARRLHAAYEVSRRNPSQPDGYPNTASGADSGPGGNPELTRVEAHAAQRIEHPNRLDPYDRTLRQALGYLADTDRALRACWNKTLELATLQQSGDLAPTEPGCWALERVGAWEPALYNVDLDGEVRRVGTWAYRFHRTHGRIPTLEECKRHTRGQRINMANEAKR